MTEPTPELLDACEEWLYQNDLLSKGMGQLLAEFVRAREQAARAQTLEQAARVADEFLLRRGGWNSYHQDAQLEIARKIRALPAAERKEPQK